MLHAALALAAVVGLPPPGGAIDRPLLALSHLRPSCAANLDPSFVRYVPPATRVKGKNPLWLLISSGTDAGAQHRPVLTAPDLACVRPILVHDER